jgi:hypothetical protein
MRATIIALATIIGLASTAHADIRRAAIPAFWGKWAASADDCGKNDAPSVALSAKQYISPAVNAPLAGLSRHLARKQRFIQHIWSVPLREPPPRKQS